MRGLLFLISAAAILAVVALGWDRRDQSRDGNGVDGQTEVELRTLRAETARLKQELERERAKATVEVPKAPATIPPELLAKMRQAAEARAAESQAPPPQTPEQLRAEMLHYASYLDAEISRSPSAEDVAGPLREQALELLGDDSALVELECGRELCRLETRHESRQAYHAFQQRAFQPQAHDERLWEGPSTFIVLEQSEDAAQPLLVAAYLGRGKALPSPHASPAQP